MCFLQVMYVGVTFTTAGPFRHDVPAVSSRSLDANNLFQIVETAVTTGTRMLVKKEEIVMLKNRFKDMVTHEDFKKQRERIEPLV